MSELAEIFERITRSGGTSRQESPIVPRASIAGSALIAVVAIMTFLGVLTTGAVLLVAGVVVLDKEAILSE